MKRFNIGETVIALTNPSGVNCQPRVKGQPYVVEAIMYCKGCGLQTINIGPKSESTYVTCTCGSEQVPDGLYWTASKHFARPQELEAEIEKAVEAEDYETAQELSLINKTIYESRN